MVWIAWFGRIGMAAVLRHGKVRRVKACCGRAGRVRRGGAGCGGMRLG